MFYADFLFAKRTALSKVWDAAHRVSNLTRREVQQINIAESVHAIEEPTVPMALRAQGQLLYGICKIYDGQTRYLMEDAQHAQAKLVTARATQVRGRHAHDAPVEQIMASNTAISLSDRRDQYDPILDQLNDNDSNMFNLSYDAGDLSGYTLSMSQQRLSQSSRLAQARPSDISLEQPRPALISMGRVDDEFELVGGGFSLDDDFDQPMTTMEQHKRTDESKEQSLYDDGSMHDERVMVDEDEARQSYSIEEAREEQKQAPSDNRASLASALGFAPDVDIDMDLAQELNASLAGMQEERKEVAPSDKTQPRAKRVKTVKFAVDDDDARIGDEEYKQQLQDRSNITVSRVEQSSLVGRRKKIPSSMLSSLLTTSTVGSGYDANDPIDRLMAELFSVAGLHTAERKHAADEEHNEAVIDEADASVLEESARLSEFMGDVDLGRDQPDHQPLEPVSLLDAYRWSQSQSQPLESSQPELEQPVLGPEELVETERVQRELSESAHRFFDEEPTEHDETAADVNESTVSTAAGEFNQRSRKVLDLLGRRFDRQPEASVQFDTLLTGQSSNRQIASSLFYQLLILSQRGAVQCAQHDKANHGPIGITKGSNFDAVRERAAAH